MFPLPTILGSLLNPFDFETSLSSNVDIDKVLSPILTSIVSIIGTLSPIIKNFVEIAVEIFLSIIGAFYISWTIAQLLIAFDLAITPYLANPSLLPFIMLLPNQIKLNMPIARQITISPQSYHDAAVGAEAWVQGFKIGSNIFSLLSLDSFFQTKNWKIGFSMSKLVVFGLFGYWFLNEYKRNKALALGTPETSVLDSSMDYLANFLQTLVSIVGGVLIAGMSFAEAISGKILEYNNYPIIPLVNIFLTGIAAAIILVFFLAKLLLGEVKTADWTNLINGLENYLLILYINFCKIKKTAPNPEYLGLLGFLVVCSDIGQYFSIRVSLNT